MKNKYLMRCVVCTIPHLYKSFGDRKVEHSNREERLLGSLLNNYIDKRNPNNLDLSGIHELSRLLNMSTIIKMYRHRILLESKLSIFVSDYILMIAPHKESDNCDQDLDECNQTTAKQIWTKTKTGVKARPVASCVPMQQLEASVQTRLRSDDVQTTRPDAESKRQ